MCCTQLCCSDVLFCTLASFGSFHVMLWPPCRTPLPASANHCQSLPVCAPYFACEKLASLLRLEPTLATHPMIGIVIIGCAPALRDTVKNGSPRCPAGALVWTMRSTYHSCS